MRELCLFIGILMAFLFIGCSEKDREENVKELTDKEKCLIMKNGESCYAKALIYGKYEEDLHKFSNPEGFIKWAEKGCEHHYSISCHNLSALFFKGDGVAADTDKAFKYGKRSCDIYKIDVQYLDKTGNEQNKLKAISSCLQLVNSFFSNEDSKYKDMEKAIDLSTLACENDVDNGCAIAGILFKKIGDESNSEKWLQWGCLKSKDSDACILLIEKYSKLKNDEKVEFYYNKLNQSWPSYNSGIVLYAETVWKIKKDVLKATHLLENALKRNVISIDEIEINEKLKDLLETKEYVEMIEKFKAIEK